MAKRHLHFNRGFFGGVGVGVGAGAVVCALELLGFGDPASGLLFALLLAGSVLASLCTLATALSPDFRGHTLTFALLGMLALPCFFLTVPLVAACQSLVFDRLIERSEPLVAAIHAYHDRHGEAPPALQALVPEFLAELPETGLPTAPTYEYQPPFPYDASNWLLLVRRPLGNRSWDQFTYDPEFDENSQGSHALTYRGKWIYSAGS